MNIREKELED